MVARYLHLLAMALFVGGQFVLVLAVVPGLRGRDRRGPARRGAALRLGVFGRAGRARGDRRVDGRRSLGRRTLQAKLGLVVLVSGLIVWHLRAAAAHWLQGFVLVVVAAIVWLGLALAH